MSGQRELTWLQNFFTNEDLHDRRDDHGTLYYVERTVERLLNEELEQLPSLENIEIAIQLTDDEYEGEKAVLGCYYFVNMESKEVFYTDEVQESHFYPGYGTSVISREHLSK